MNLSSAIRKSGEALRGLHWRRGLRAGLAVAGAMIVCQVFGKTIGWATGWAALGGFEAILVDTGGPYRARFATMATLLAGGSLGCLAAAWATGPTPLTAVVAAMLMTAAFCFAVTFARVVAQPIASTSVIILVIYLAALGSGVHSLRQAALNALAFVAGGAWAAVLSLVLWPVDPFRPGRQAVAECYAMLAEFTAGVAATPHGSEEREEARRRGFDFQRRMRRQIELARAALMATTARAPSRTILARNLTVLLETADMLLGITMRATELALRLEVGGGVAVDPLGGFVGWISEAERGIAAGLLRRPVGGTSLDGMRFSAGEGSVTESGAAPIGRVVGAGTELGAVVEHLSAAELDAAQNIEIAREALRALWSGVESRAGSRRLTLAVELRGSGPSRLRGWMDALRSNWSLDSVMMRHALRMTVVGAIDVLLLRALNLRHGYWLGMTSIIVLQPYPTHTLKKGAERVGGTIAGGFLAALLAAAISGPVGIIAVVTVTATLTLATYAVDYAWYCFFLTPTFVLMSLPHLHDWVLAGERMLTTLLGAVVAVGAMRLLWTEREDLALGQELAKSAGADAGYIRAMLRYWREVFPADGMRSTGSEERRLAEREILAPARRACGLASNDAEEALDRLMLEPRFGPLAVASPTVKDHAVTLTVKDHALTFVTYIRRLTQSVTMLALLGRADGQTVEKLEALAGRLERVSAGLQHQGLSGNHEESGSALAAATAEGAEVALQDDSDIAVYQVRRMERQVSVLERAAVSLGGGSDG